MSAEPVNAPVNVPVTVPVNAPLHPLLLRQLRRLGLGTGGAPEPGALAAAPPQADALLRHVSQAYHDADKDRYLLERSQEISSREMSALNAALRVSESRLTSLVTLSADWVWEQGDDLCFKYISGKPSALSGLDPMALNGRSMATDPGFEWKGGDFDTLQRALAARAPYRDVVFGLRGPDGRRCVVRISGEPVFASGAFAGYRGVGSDVTLAAQAEAQIERLARYDGLTGLPNRNMFMDELDRALARARRDSSMFAVFFIDLDRFKNVNDTLGHVAGDKLLCAVAERLKDVLRDADMIARLGGDEFVLVLEGCTDSALLAKVASRTLAAIAEPVTLDGHRVHVTGSIGVSVFPTDGADATQLVKNADAAMYQAKALGKNNFQYYTEALARLAARHFELEGELRGAVERDELRLHYQPRFAVATGELLGMEALLRWQHPVHGLLSPGSFIEIAEEGGLIVLIGRWVIRAACRQLRDWARAGHTLVPCAVNVSVHQLASATLLADLSDALACCLIEPNLFEVEVTESVLMADPRAAAAVLHQIHDLGVAISIDDFGTGYSSLAYLKRFPANTLKIDQSFVRGLPHDADDVAIVQAVIAMAHSLGLCVVAEGVETPAQLAFLKALGCDEVQGYLLGRPVAPDLLAAQLARTPSQSLDTSAVQ